MTIFHNGDIVLVNSPNDKYKDFNGNLARFISYYPAVSSDEDISNLHSCMISAQWIPSGSNKPGVMTISPLEILKVTRDTLPVDIVFHQNYVNEVVKNDIDEILNRRLQSGIRLVDQMIGVAIDKYIKDLEENSPEIKNEFYKRCEEAILQKGSLYDGDVTFREHLRQRINELADVYIKNHTSELQDLMQDSIQHAAAHLSEDELCKKIGTVVESWLKDKF